MMKRIDLKKWFLWVGSCLAVSYLFVEFIGRDMLIESVSFLLLVVHLGLAITVFWLIIRLVRAVEKIADKLDDD